MDVVGGRDIRVLVSGLDGVAILARLRDIGV